MYFNNVHILYYVLFGLVGLLIGHFMNWCNHRLPEYKKVFSKDFRKEKVKPNYWMMLANAGLYIALLYCFGIDTTSWMGNLELIKFLILTPMLTSVFAIDYKHQIIPNRLSLTLFELGLIFTFIYGLTNINIAVDMLLGMLVGGGIFLLITLIGGLIAGKEAMGFGDVKLMGALGLIFGVNQILAIAVMSFLIGAVLSIFLLVTKIKKTSDYIPFGPFIVLATIIMMFVPFQAIYVLLLKIFTLGLYHG
ncbi:MAG: prepilin peptidase [Clostridia bacterium]